MFPLEHALRILPMAQISTCRQFCHFANVIPQQQAYIDRSRLHGPSLLLFSRVQSPGFKTNEYPYNTAFSIRQHRELRFGCPRQSRRSTLAAQSPHVARRTFPAVTSARPLYTHVHYVWQAQLLGNDLLQRSCEELQISCVVR